MESATPAPRRIARFLLKLVIVLLITLTGLEFGLRWLLFGESELAVRLGSRLRTPQRFSMHREDEFWRLRHALEGEVHLAPGLDPVLGWRGNLIRGEEFEHRHRTELKGRRPVLLYGDSYACCVTHPRDCWQGLLRRSPLDESLRLLNFGVGGFGVDQALVLLQHTIDAWVERDPIVVFCILIDDDFDRCMLTARTGPKPWFSISSEGLLVPHPPDIPTPLPEEPPDPGIPSYLWRWIVHGPPNRLPSGMSAYLRGDAEHVRKTQQLASLLLEQLKSEMESRGLEYFVVVFHEKFWLMNPDYDNWREEFTLGELERQEIPWVSSRRVLEEHMLEAGVDRESFYRQPGEKNPRHYNEFGNEVVFRAIVDGLNGQYDGSATPR